MSTLVNALRQRETAKVLTDPNTPLPVGDDKRAIVDAMLNDAGWAPFHYPSNPAHHAQLGSPVPWRFYKFDTAECRKIANELSAPDSGAGKIVSMLSAADALLQVTWLPDPIPDGKDTGDNEYIGTQRNMEHIAATAAAIQNMLLLATEQGFRTYWSTGGVLRDANCFERMGIPSKEVLLGSVFLYPADVGDSMVKAGLWRDKRGESSDWSAWRDFK